MASHIEDIRQRLKTAEASPEKADLQTELADLLLNTEPEQALVLTEAALALSVQLNYRLGQARSHLAMGKSYERITNYPQALHHGLAALALAEAIGDQKATNKCLSHVGLAYSRLGNFNKALEHCFRALRAAADAGDAKTEAGLLNNIGSLYLRLGDFPKAQEYFQKGFALLRGSADDMVVAGILNNIGLACQGMGNLSQALSLFEQSLHLRQQAGDKRAQADSWNNLGIVYQETKEYQRARDCWNRALDLAISCKDLAMQVYTMLNLGELSIDTGEVDSGLDLFEQAGLLAEQLGDRSILAKLLRQMAIAYERKNEVGRALGYHLKHFLGSIELLTENANAIGQQRGHENILVDEELRKLRTDALASIRRSAEQLEESFRQLATAHHLLREDGGPDAIPEAQRRQWRAIEVELRQLILKASPPSPDGGNVPRNIP